MKKIDWVGTKQTALALDISREKLIDWLKAGVLKSGKHYRNLSKGKKRPTYRFNIQAIKEIFEV